MRITAMPKPAISSGASGRSRRPRIATWYMTCTRPASSRAASEAMRAASGSSGAGSAPSCASATRCRIAATSWRAWSQESPRSEIRSASASAPAPSAAAIFSRSGQTRSPPTAPSMSATCEAVTLPEPKAMAWSVRLRLSRTLPAAARASSASAGSSKGMPSASSTCLRCPASACGGSAFRLNCRQRDSTVTGRRCGSVVARMNFTCSGGSSSVFSIELNACRESMCTSSMM